MTNDEQRQAIHDIVAGVRPLSEISRLGIEMRVSEWKDTTSLRREWTFGACEHLGVQVTRRTIARGMLLLREAGADVEAWAAFLLAAPFISVAGAKDQDELIQLLWNVSFGEQLTEEELALLGQHAADGATVTDDRRSEGEN